MCAYVLMEFWQLSMIIGKKNKKNQKTGVSSNQRQILIRKKNHDIVNICTRFSFEEDIFINQNNTL